ncbi:MAG: HD family hydrolase [Thermococcus sp.]|uniref:5'-deoxynucleotidase n=1 Tax=Thermococcus guaymasensis DSM 11113 TaxID=1432656 RepID=A0A0X1KHM3_9EURY|nr:HD family hydrolase [Thermococcus guaymasensis]AJC70755.1 oxetanocin [Thermococcus guaymasensis DSM 11113]MCD6524547.1 HD family hydrolase [Thermococcus sp.]RLF87256.1 MAG: HD family hydrolase [Thermococci archaeon]
MLELFLELGNLKRLPRTGWLLRGVPSPEPIAAHSYRVAMITLFLADELKSRGVEIDVEKALKIALLHDVGEARMTDIPMPAQRYFNKVKGEVKALREMLSVTGREGEYLSLFREYEEELSVEGKLVKFADRLEMLIQAYEYEKAGFRNLDEFWGAVNKLRESELYRYFGELVEGLVERREKLHRG